jgi:hypothetical protein
MSGFSSTGMGIFFKPIHKSILSLRSAVTPVTSLCDRVGRPSVRARLTFCLGLGAIDMNG